MSKPFEALFHFARFRGFTFLIIPAIWLEHHHPEIATRTRMMTPGNVIFAGLVILFYWLITTAITPTPFDIGPN